jgi:hypothetical protein
MNINHHTSKWGLLLFKSKNIASNMENITFSQMGWFCFYHPLHEFIKNPSCKWYTKNANDTQTTKFRSSQEYTTQLMKLKYRIVATWVLMLKRWPTRHVVLIIIVWKCNICLSLVRICNVRGKSLDDIVSYFVIIACTKKFLRALNNIDEKRSFLMKNIKLSQRTLKNLEIETSHVK